MLVVVFRDGVLKPSLLVLHTGHAMVRFVVRRLPIDDGGGCCDDDECPEIVYTVTVTRKPTPIREWSLDRKRARVENRAPISLSARCIRQRTTLVTCHASDLSFFSCDSFIEPCRRTNRDCTLLSLSVCRSTTHTASRIRPVQSTSLPNGRAHRSQNSSKLSKRQKMTDG